LRPETRPIGVTVTRAPSERAISAVLSLLPWSTTTISSAKFAERRQRAIRRLLVLANHDQGKARHSSSKTTGDVIEKGSTMPHPAPPVQSAADRTIFVRQQFSQFGGAELILDRLLAALTARGKRVALLGRSWRGGRNVEFIRCDRRS